MTCMKNRPIAAAVQETTPAALSLHSRCAYVLRSEEDLSELHDMRVPQLAVVDELTLHIAQHKVRTLQLLDCYLFV